MGNSEFAERRAAREKQIKQQQVQQQQDPLLRDEESNIRSPAPPPEDTSFWGYVGGFFTSPWIIGLVWFLMIAFLGMWIAFLIEWQDTSNKIKVDHFDFVIIGCGAAGSALANRLSENGTYSVACFESGPDYDADPQINLVVNSGTLQTNYFNKFFWQNQQNSPNAELGHGDYTGGRLLGGSSSINGMQYVRGTDWMFQYWYNVTLDQIWNLTNVIANYIDFENTMCPNCNPITHGEGGPLQVLELMTTAPQTTPTSMTVKLVTSITRFTNLAAIPDYNNFTVAAELGPFNDWQDTSYANGTRSSGSISMLNEAVRARRNLHIHVNATVTRVRFNSDKSVKQVNYLHNGKPRIAKARRETIVAAGVRSPELLLHSGIGPGGKIANLPVGQDVRNHPLYIVIFTKNISDVPSANPNDIYEGGAWLPLAPNFTLPNAATESISPRVYQLIGTNTGALMVLVGLNTQSQAIGNLFTWNNDPLKTVAENDNVYIGNGGANNLAMAFSLYFDYFCGIAKEFQGDGVGPAIDNSYVMIDPPYSFCFNASLMQGYVDSYSPDHAHHWVKQNRMGIQGDGVSVVNGKGTVHGIKGLRVADASIIPHAFDGNTQAPAYLIGWTIAGEILAGRS